MDTPSSPTEKILIDVLLIKITLMGLDMRPLGKPKPGYEKRFSELFNIFFREEEYPKPTFWGKLFGKKYPTEEELTQEWFDIQIPSYETIKAPCVGRDKEADEWAKERYHEKYDDSDEKPTFEEFMKHINGYYVIELAKELDGVPKYISPMEDENVFRGEFLRDCIDLFGDDLVNEAWESKTADEALDYGNRLMAVAEAIAKKHNMEYLKDQRMPPEEDGKEPSELTALYVGDANFSTEEQLHVVFSLAKWLIFYGKNGHGYHAYY